MTLSHLFLAAAALGALTGLGIFAAYLWSLYRLRPAK